MDGVAETTRVQSSGPTVDQPRADIPPPRVVPTGLPAAQRRVPHLHQHVVGVGVGDLAAQVGDRHAWHLPLAPGVAPEAETVEVVEVSRAPGVVRVHPQGAIGSVSRSDSGH